MFIRLVNFRVDPDKKVDMLNIADEMMAEIKERKGCMDCNFIMKDDSGEYGLVVFWESQEDADASVKVIGPKYLPKINDIAKEPATVKLYEVYES